ncbi:hypothetical protein Tco_1417402 [Tanacetum coccineum]
MVKQEKPLKKKDHIKFNEEIAQRLQAQMQAELEKEERLAREREEDANIAKWDNAQAMMDADYELATRIQKEELKQCFEIVPDDGDDVTIDATPLSVKIPIVDYKIYQEGKKSFF